MEYVSPFTEKINMIMGAVTALLAYMFGENWPLFGIFFVLNVADVITGIIKAEINRNSNSHKGYIGILKKLAYWIMILVSFSISVCFQEIGRVIGINLGVTSLIGWFVLATLIINEARSILENLVESNVKVPSILIKGLEVANQAIDGTIKLEEKPEEDDE